MKKWIFCAIALTCAAQVAFADPQWLTDVPKAEAQAKKENKLVLLDFTGSDWCVWCKKLDEDVFAKPDFQRYASTNLVLVQLDYPQRKAQPAALKAANEALQIKFNIEGFPTLYLLKPDGSVVWKQVGYPEGGVTGVLAEMDKARKK